MEFAAHAEHVEAPPNDEYVPSSQSVQTAAPASEYFPATQLPQSVALVCASEPEYLPAAQSVQAGAPAEYFPASQLVQTSLVVPTAAWYFPAAQR